MSEELKPCPFCGEVPDLPSGDGTQYEIECGACGSAMVSVQISTLMTHEERSSDPFTDYRYAEQFIERAKTEAIELWNTRVTPPAAQVQGEQPEVVAWRYGFSGGVVSDKACLDEWKAGGEHQPLMTVAQHQRIVAALQAETARLKVMADNYFVIATDRHLEIEQLKDLLRYFDEHGATQAWVTRYKQALEGAALSAPPADGVPEGWRRAVYQAEECLTGCLASLEIARSLDVETVRKIIANLQATRFAMLAAAPTPPASEQQQAVVLPERDDPEMYAPDSSRYWSAVAWNACLDEFLRLNPHLAGVNQGVTEAGNGGDV